MLRVFQESRCTFLLVKEEGEQNWDNTLSKCYNVIFLSFPNNMFRLFNYVRYIKRKEYRHAIFVNVIPAKIPKFFDTWEIFSVCFQSNWIKQEKWTEKWWKDVKLSASFDYIWTCNPWVWGSRQSHSPPGHRPPYTQWSYK